MLETIIDEILDRVTQGLKRIADVLSFTLVGSYYRRRKAEKNNDLDLVIVLRRITDENYVPIRKLFGELVEKYTTNDLDVIYEDVAGPIKHGAQKKAIIILHQLLHWVSEYKEYCKTNRLTPYSWQFCEPILGKPLSEIHKLEKPSKEDVLDSRSGIKHYIRIVRDKQINGRAIQRTNSTYDIVEKTIIPEGVDYIDLMYNGVLKCASNVVRLKEDIDIHEESKCVKRFESLFGDFEFSGFPRQTLKKKKVLRGKTAKANETFIKTTKKETLMFLTELKIYVESSL